MIPLNLAIASRISRTQFDINSFTPDSYASILFMIQYLKYHNITNIPTSQLCLFPMEDFWYLSEKNA